MSHVEPYFSFFQQKGKRNCSFGYTAMTFYRFCHILWKQFDFYEKQRVSLPAVWCSRRHVLWLGRDSYLRGNLGQHLWVRVFRASWLCPVWLIPLSVSNRWIYLLEFMKTPLSRLQGGGWNRVNEPSPAHFLAFRLRPIQESFVYLGSLATKLMPFITWLREGRLRGCEVSGGSWTTAGGTRRCDDWWVESCINAGVLGSLNASECSLSRCRLEAKPLINPENDDSCRIDSGLHPLLQQPLLLQCFASVNTGVETVDPVSLGHWLTPLMLGHRVSLCLRGGLIHPQSVLMVQNGSIQKKKWKCEIKNDPWTISHRSPLRPVRLQTVRNEKTYVGVFFEQIVLFFFRLTAESEAFWSNLPQPENPVMGIPERERLPCCWLIKQLFL